MVCARERERQREQREQRDALLEPKSHDRSIDRSCLQQITIILRNGSGSGSSRSSSNHSSNAGRSGSNSSNSSSSSACGLPPFPTALSPLDRRLQSDEHPGREGIERTGRSRDQPTDFKGKIT